MLRTVLLAAATLLLASGAALSAAQHHQLTTGRAAVERAVAALHAGHSLPPNTTFAFPVADEQWPPDTAGLTASTFQAALRSAPYRVEYAPAWQTVREWWAEWPGEPWTLPPVITHVRLANGSAYFVQAKPQKEGWRIEVTPILMPAPMPLTLP